MNSIPQQGVEALQGQTLWSFEADRKSSALAHAERAWWLGLEDWLESEEGMRAEGQELASQFAIQCLISKLHSHARPRFL